MEATQQIQVLTRRLSETLCVRAMPVPCFQGHCLLVIHAQTDIGRPKVESVTASLLVLSSLTGEWEMQRAGALWPALDQDNRHALLSHQQLADSGFGRKLVSMPIRTETGIAIGSILVSFSEQDDQAAEQERLRETERLLRRCWRKCKPA